jgi:hypothetical protein
MDHLSGAEVLEGIQQAMVSMPQSAAEVIKEHGLTKLAPLLSRFLARPQHEALTTLSFSASLIDRWRGASAAADCKSVDASWRRGGLSIVSRYLQEQATGEQSAISNHRLGKNRCRVAFREG